MSCNYLLTQVDPRKVPISKGPGKPLHLQFIKDLMQLFLFKVPVQSYIDLTKTMAYCMGICLSH